MVAVVSPLMATSTSAGAVKSQATSATGGQRAELTGSDTLAGDNFGDPVAISRTTTGRAHVFSKAGAVWKQAAELSGSGAVANDALGVSVSVSGTTAVVGGEQAYVFTKAAVGWKQAAELKNSGLSVSISGTTALVGGHVFTKTATGWKQVAELKGTGSEGTSVTSVAISGTTAVVGAGGHANNAGTAYVFAKTATGWKQVAELKGSDTVAFDGFGDSVAISGTTIVIGADGHKDNAGRAYVFAKTAGVWKQTAELKGSDTVANDSFGVPVAISGTTVVVGAGGHANNVGRAYVFEA